MLQLEPDDEAAIKGLGRVFKKRGQTDLARKYLDHALLLNPRDDRSRELLSELCEETSKF